MREIKFRGKREDTKEWVYGDLIHYNEQFVINVYETEVGYYAYQVPIIPKTVGQFTGLLDKNGKEIYEGDILDMFESAFNDKRVKVKFDEEYGYYYPFGNGNYSEYPYETEVIGNIHDNKELL